MPASAPLVPHLNPLSCQIVDQVRFIAATLKAGGEVYRLVKHHGRVFTVSGLPFPATLASRRGRGYAALLEACFDNQSWHYAEGFVTTPSVPFPQPSGWVVDETGHVLAAAYASNLEGWQFFGIAFQSNFLVHRLTQGSRLPLLLAGIANEISRLPDSEWKFTPSNAALVVKGKEMA
jgi:hypothetical protein